MYVCELVAILTGLQLQQLQLINANVLIILGQKKLSSHFSLASSTTVWCKRVNASKLFCVHLHSTYDKIDNKQICIQCIKHNNYMED